MSSVGDRTHSDEGWERKDRKMKGDGTTNPPVPSDYTNDIFTCLPTQSVHLRVLLSEGTSS